MTCRLDHIVVVAHTLQAGSRFVEHALGVAPGPGRSHPHMGTHNLLLSLGPATYLEVVAIDPEAPPLARPRWFGLDRLPTHPSARLAAWVADTDDIHCHASAALGEVEQMERAGLHWQMTMPPDGGVPLDGAAPLLIQRAVAVHPAARLPDPSLRLRRLLVRHSSPDAVACLLARIGFSPPGLVTWEKGDVPALCAEIETPHGIRMLGDQQAG